MNSFNIDNIDTGQDLFFILGPCVIESEKSCFNLAKEIKEICQKADVKFIFKASFDKANRSSIKSYRGPGIKRGLEILQNIKQELKIPVISDIHLPTQAKIVQDTLSIIQIPAFLSRQTDLLVAAGETGLPVNIKKAQFMAPEDMLQVAKKIESTGNKQILFTERGTTFGYNNLTVDFRSIQIMKNMGYSVIMDATHSVQRPALQGECSGGNPEFIPTMAKCGLVSGASAIFLEVHPQPDKALSDGSNSLKLNKLYPLLLELKKLYNIEYGH